MNIDVLEDSVLYSLIQRLSPDCLQSTVVAGQEARRLAHDGKLQEFEDGVAPPPRHLFVSVGQRKVAVWQDLTRPELRQPQVSPEPLWARPEPAVPPPVALVAELAKPRAELSQVRWSP